MTPDRKTVLRLAFRSVRAIVPLPNTHVHSLTSPSLANDKNVTICFTPRALEHSLV